MSSSSPPTHVPGQLHHLQHQHHSLVMCCKLPAVLQRLVSKALRYVIGQTVSVSECVLMNSVCGGGGGGGGGDLCVIVWSV